MTKDPVMVEDHTPGTFLGLRPVSDAAAVRYVVLPVPYEGTVCYGTGAAAGPAAILNASPHMERYDEQTGVHLERCGILTAPAVEPADEPAEQMRRVYDACRTQHEAGRFVLMLGGEHSITAPAARAAMDVGGPVSVLQFDAHADLRDAYTGGRYSHASVMRRISELTDTVVQVGVRSWSAEEAAQCPGAIGRLITDRRVRADLDEAIATILERLTDRVYVTIDMDVFAPGLAPGVGTPEPGGLTWFELTDLLRAVARCKTICAADVVETAPLPDQLLTEFTAARLAGKVIAYTAATR
ncbi:MAG: agmatinase [Planctomycetota bacterium]